MEITRKYILEKTHYGLNIYSFILRCYYPGETVLSLSGKGCKPTKNPFCKDALTLVISIVDNCAVHFDMEKAIPDGDVFDFAALHFKKEGQELYNLIDEELHLHIGQQRNFYKIESKLEPATEITEVNRSKFKIPVCSYFKHPISNIIPFKAIDIKEVYRMIKGDLFYTQTNRLRDIKDSKLARKYKAYHFDYVTFSGTFSKRNDYSLISHSGLLTLDFDHVSDTSSLKDNLLEDKYFETELMFVSPSGDGVKWIIRIDLTKAKHKDYFVAVSNYIQQTYQLEVDQSGKDISRACFIPCDKEVYINPEYL